MNWGNEKRAGGVNEGSDLRHSAAAMSPAQYAPVYPAIVCAWCSKVLATIATFNAAPEISHGICAACDENLRKDASFVLPEPK